MASFIKGIDIILYETYSSGKDPFGGIVESTKETVIKNVLVVPTLPEDIVKSENLWGKKAVYMLAIPKGDTHDWKDKKVRFFNQDFRTFGIPAEGIEAMIPMDWNKKVMVERYE